MFGVLRFARFKGFRLQGLGLLGCVGGLDVFLSAGIKLYRVFGAFSISVLGLLVLGVFRGFRVVSRICRCFPGL